MVEPNINVRNQLMINDRFKGMLTDFVSEQWYQNVVKATKDKRSVFNLLDLDARQVQNPKLIIVGDIFYSMSMNCAALQGFVQELVDEFEFTTDISSADVRKLLQEGVMIFDISTYKLEDAKNKSYINDCWKMLIKTLITRIIEQNPYVMVMSLGYNANNMMKDLVTCSVLKNDLLLCTGHPSPKASTSTFRGSMCFKEVNKRLINSGRLPVRFGIIFT